MIGISILVVVFICGNLVWWQQVDRALRPLPGARVWRAMNLAVTAYILVYSLLLVIYGTPLRASSTAIPVGGHAFVYIWNCIGLPLALSFWGIYHLGRRAISLLSRWMFIDDSRTEGSPAADVAAASSVAPATPENPPPSLRMAPEKTSPTRRQVLTAAALAIPALATAGVAEDSVRRMSEFRLRRFELLFPQLPPQLEGMTIAHVSDTHIGKFLRPHRLPAIAAQVNALDADFIAFTGDLIDVSLSDLKYGIPFLQSLRSRCGMVICEGNHDLMEGRAEFEEQLRQADLPIIIGEQLMLPYRSRDGKSYPIQFLGTPWNNSDVEMADAVEFIRPQIRRDAFPILLAHHPHSFDPAAAANIPLVLSGHTHGGQIMLNSEIGVGAIRFKYNSGLYQRLGSNLIVNNGLGNWFPLRINAPAEIVHITLKGG